MKSLSVQSEDHDDSSVDESCGVVPVGKAAERDSLSLQPTKLREESVRNRFVNEHGGKEQ